MVSLPHYLIVAALLFCLGVMGVLTRKNILIIFMCIELMLNSANLTFVAFARQLGNIEGQIFVFFVMAVAAAEVAVGLAIIVVLYRFKNSVNIDSVNLMKW
jgi:NADH-quinone oxidoreductase subunit K